MRTAEARCVPRPSADAYMTAVTASAVIEITVAAWDEL
jgi:hypothetical protein